MIDKKRFDTRNLFEAGITKYEKIVLKIKKKLEEEVGFEISYADVEIRIDTGTDFDSGLIKIKLRVIFRRDKHGDENAQKFLEALMKLKKEQFMVKVSRGYSFEMGGFSFRQNDWFHVFEIVFVEIW